MTQDKPTIEGNKLISDFMDLSRTDQNKYPFGQPITGVNFREAKYHTSWDWLMPVVEKIESIEEAPFDGLSTNIRSVWVAVVRAIRLHKNPSLLK